MEGGSGSGCACCGCGYLVLFIAIVVAIVMIFVFVVPTDSDYEQLIPDEFQEFYPDLEDGTGIPSNNGSIQPGYALSASYSMSYTAF